MRRAPCAIRLEGEGGRWRRSRAAVRAYFHGAYRMSREAVRARPVRLRGERRRRRAVRAIDALRISARRARAGLRRRRAEAARRGWLFALCESRARTLGNLPANLLGAEAMARYLSDMAAARGLGVRVLGDAELRALGCGGILAVNAACPREAKLVVLEYRPAGCAQPPVGLVGKGVMFDAGGIHLKDIRSMEGMKFDMCGAASAAELVEYAAMTGGATPLIAVLPLVENAIGASATRMGDVIATLSGQTVEIYNADAEGRLVLCDALAYAQRLGARTVIDMATLTNGCHAALGDEVAGWFATRSRSPSGLRRARASGEPMWRLPLMDCYREAIAGRTARTSRITRPARARRRAWPPAFWSGLSSRERVGARGHGRPRRAAGKGRTECAGARGFGMVTVAALIDG